ncbi:MAG: DUF4430 domain-containing protein, partial [Bacillota bacterium]|nr:DUF4430 domain-containing protein [Bacillota bacterium]
MKNRKKRSSKIIAVLMALFMLTGMLPATAFADDGSTQQVRVIVENTIWTAEDGAPWEGELIDTYVEINEETTMLSALTDALKAEGKTLKGADTNTISEVNGLANGAAGADCKWKGSVNEQDVNEKFADYAVSKGNLVNGSVIRITYDGTVTVKAGTPGPEGGAKAEGDGAGDEDADEDSDSDQTKEQTGEATIEKDAEKQNSGKDQEEETAETQETPSLMAASPLMRSTLGGISLMSLGNSADTHENQVRVIVENTTFPVADGAPWEGTLVDTWVDLNADSTMMSCVVAALGTVGATQSGAENNYVEVINGLAAFDGGNESGWMGTLNDWFTNAGFGAFTVANGGLEAGDEIRIMYTTNGYGEDLGGSWSNNDKTVKDIAFSKGTLSPVFSKDTKEYTLTVPKNTSGVIVTPTASNKNFQVRTSVGEVEYKRNAKVPVEEGTTIKVKCGDPSWPTMNGAGSVAAEEYTINVEFETTNALPVLKKGVESTVSAAGYVAEPYSLDLSTIFEDPNEESLTYTVSVNGQDAVAAAEDYSFTP